MCVCISVCLCVCRQGALGSIPGHAIPKTLKMVLDTALLITQQYKVRIEGKAEQSRERSRALPYSKQFKRKPSGHRRLQSPILLYLFIYLYM